MSRAMKVRNRLANHHSHAPSPRLGAKSSGFLSGAPVEVLRWWLRGSPPSQLAGGR